MKWRGGQQQLWWLLEGLQAQGIKQTLAVPERSALASRVQASLASTESDKGIKMVPLAETSGRVLRLENARLIRATANECDLVHAHDAHGHTLAWAAQKLSRRHHFPPVLVARRVTFPIRWLGRLKNRQPAWFIAVSEYVRKQLIESGIAPARTRVVHDGVRLPTTLAGLQERNTARRQMQVDDGAFVLGTLTSVAAEKMLPDTLRWFASLPENCWLLIGVPQAQAAEPETSALRELADALGCGKRVRIVPVIANAATLLDALDVFVYFSRSEGLGSAILLAMAHGLPVIASRAGGIPEIVIPGETGVLLDTSSPGWEAAGLDAVQHLQADPGRRNRFGTLARGFVAEHASSDNMVARTLSIYREVLDAGAAQAKESRLATT
jgi:glycosyltransferase involved in cell wall biosynthesis